MATRQRRTTRTQNRENAWIARPRPHQPQACECATDAVAAAEWELYSRVEQVEDSAAGASGPSASVSEYV